MMDRTSSRGIGKSPGVQGSDLAIRTEQPYDGPDKLAGDWQIPRHSGFGFFLIPWRI